MEDGRSFFDVLFEQDAPLGSTEPTRPRTYESTRDTENHADADADNENGKEKTRGHAVRDGVKKLVKSGVDSLKSILPTNHHDDDKEKESTHDSGRKGSSGAVDRTINNGESPSLMDKLKDTLKRSNSPPNATDDEAGERPQASYERLWQASSPKEGRRRENTLLVMDAAYEHHSSALLGMKVHDTITKVRSASNSSIDV